MTTNRYVLASIGALLLVCGLTVSHASSAQSYNVPSCSTNTPVVNVNQSAVFTPYGGNGNYYWSGDNLNISNPNGTQLTVSYPVAGNYTIRVSSNGQTGTCSLTVVGNTPVVPIITPGLPNTGGGYGHW